MYRPYSKTCLNLCFLSSQFVFSRVVSYRFKMLSSLSCSDLCGEFQRPSIHGWCEACKNDHTCMFRCYPWIVGLIGQAIFVRWWFICDRLEAHELFPFFIIHNSRMVLVGFTMDFSAQVLWSVRSLVGLGMNNVYGLARACLKSDSWIVIFSFIQLGQFWVLLAS